MAGMSDTVRGPVAIETRQLGKSYGERHALRRVDLAVKRGECLSVFGPNGAGKTTLVKLLCTMSRPSSGSALIDGDDIRESPSCIRCKLGVVSHATFLYPDLTLVENLRFYGRMYSVPDLDRRIAEVLDQVELKTRMHDRVGTLSRGLQQRAAIARAIIHDPPIMLLDEPETGLDPHATTMIRGVLDTINRGQRTVVITTHDLDRGLELGDHILILDRGRIAYECRKRSLDTVGLRDVYDRCVRRTTR